MNCKHCNAPLNDEAEFCAVCGTPTLRGTLDKEAVVPLAEEELPSAFDEMIDEAYDAAESGKDFNGSVPFTQVYKPSDESEEPEDPAKSSSEEADPADAETVDVPNAEEKPPVPIKKSKKILKKIIISVLILVLLSASTFALHHFEIVHIPFLDGIFTSDTDNSDNADTPAPVTDTSRVTLSALRATPADIPVGVDTETVFTLHVSNPDHADLNHLKVFGDGMELCTLNDKGEDGDELAGDNIYSGTCTFTSAVPSVLSCKAMLGQKESVPFEVSCYRELSTDDSSRFKAFNEKLFNFTTYADAKAFVEQSDEVETYVATDSLNTISCKTKYGVTCIWQPAAVTETYDAEQAVTLYNTAQEQAQNLPHNAAHTKNDVAVIRPFEDSGLSAKDFEYAGELLADNLNSNAEHFVNTLVSVDRMKSLDVYGIVLLNNHQLLLDGTHPQILLGETIPEDLSIYREDFQANRIVVSNGRLAVGASFFKKYYGYGALQESFWFLGMPANASENTLTEALIDCGAETVFSICDSVNDATCRDILYEYMIANLLLEGNTAKESIHQIVNEIPLSVAGNTEYLLNAKPVRSENREICVILDSSDNVHFSAFADALTGTEIFTDTVLAEDCSVSIISYGNTANIASDFSDNPTLLFARTEAIPASGGSNPGDGLIKAYTQFNGYTAKEKIAVLVMGSIPDSGMQDAELSEYAETLKNNGVVLYTISFVPEGADDSVHTLAEQLASPGCHYRTENSAELGTQLENVARQITGIRFIHLKIEGPVFAKISANGETLSSNPNNQILSANFGTLSVENTDSKQKIALFKLNEKSADSFALHMEGSDEGKIQITLSYANKKGIYTDTRSFKNISVDYETRLYADVARSDKTSLEADTDGDGDTDTTYEAAAGSVGKEKSKMPLYLTLGGIGLFVLLVLIVVIIIAIKRAKRRKAEAFKAPKLCPNCGAIVIDDACPHCNTKIED